MALALRKPPFGANLAKVSFLLEIDPVPMYYHVAKYFVETLYSLRYEHFYETQGILLKLIKHHKNRVSWLGCGMVKIALEKATVVNEINIGYVVIYHVSRK